MESKKQNPLFAEKLIAEDCFQLVEIFSQECPQPLYKSFSEIWYKRGFHYLYTFLPSAHTSDVPNVTHAAIVAGLRLLCTESKPSSFRIGALYLLYTLFFTQFGNWKAYINITAKNLRMLDQFLTSLDKNLQETRQAKYIFYKIFDADGFHFTARQGQISMIEDLVDNSYLGLHPHGLTDFEQKCGLEATTRLLNLCTKPIVLKVLLCAYNEMKEMLKKKTNQVGEKSLQPSQIDLSWIFELNTIAKKQYKHREPKADADDNDDEDDEDDGDDGDDGDDDDDGDEDKKSDSDPKVQPSEVVGYLLNHNP